MMRVRILLMVIIAAIANAASAEIDTLRSSVVRIIGDEEGAGIIIGSDERSVFVATVAHVAKGTNIRVRFLAAPLRDFSAEVIRTEDEVDFAVLIVSVPAADSVRSDLPMLAYRSGPVPNGTTVSNIGHPAGEQWQVNADVNKLQGSGLNSFTFSKIGIARGSSGGPLFDDQGRLIGLVTQQNAAVARALKVDAMLSLLQDWNVRSNLLTAKAPAAPQPTPQPQPQPETCRVAVLSTPAAAAVIVAGQRKGTTPTSLSIPRGESVNVLIEKKGYKSEELTADCSTPDLAVTLEQDITTGSVTIVYTGDVMACNLQLTMSIGGHHFIPTGNSYVVQNVPLGTVQYSISGRIGCLTGVCNASGQGTISIEDGDTIYVGWINNAYATCTVQLRK